VGKTEKAFMQSILNDTPVPPSVHRKGYPAGLEKVLSKALARDPDQRFPDALELQVALERFLMEQKAVSNSTLISRYVRELFHDLLDIQFKASPDGRTATVEGILDALEVSSSIRYAIPPLPGAPAEEPVPFVEDEEETTAPTKRFTKKDDGTYVLVTPSQVISRPWIKVKTIAKSLGTGARRMILGGVALACVLGLVAIFAAGSSEPVEPRGQYLPVMLYVQAWEEARVAARSPVPVPAKPKRPPKKRVVQPAGKGSLTINTQPWSEVWVDGKKLGLTPLAYKELPAGRHRLVLKNPRLKLKKAVWIRIQANKTTEMEVDLRK
jgi:serine/threonine-protein kinase